MSEEVRLETEDGRPVWEEQRRIDEYLPRRWRSWVLKTLLWVSIAYLCFGALMILGMALSLLGLRTSFAASQMLGFGMASFFIGGVLFTLLDINEQVARLRSLARD